MKVRDCMTRGLTTVGADQNLQEAAESMRTAEVGMLPVHDNDRLVGLITDRDIAVRAIAKGSDPKTTKVGELMTRDVATCNEDDDAEVAAARMKELQVRRLLVLDDSKKVSGVITLGDLATKSECAPLAEDALAGVCQPTA